MDRDPPASPFPAAFWRLVASSGLSNLADGVFKMALPLVAIVYTRSPVLVAGLEFVRMLPWLAGALPVGALTDRIDRRRSMLWANGARSAVVTTLGVAIAAGSGSIWLLYGAAVSIGIAEVFYDTAAQSMLPSIVSRSDLDRANGRLFAVELGAQELIGPLVAGLILAVSASAAFFAPGAAWILAVGALVLVRGVFRPAVGSASRGSIRSDVAEGLGFIRRDRVLRTMAVVSALATVALGAAFSVLVLFVVGEDSPMGLSNRHYVLVFAAMAAGGVVGGAVTDRIVRQLGRSTAISLAVVGLAVAVASPALTTNLVAIVATQFVGGVGNMQWNIIAVSYRQRATPDALLGRVNSFYRLVSWGARPVGAFLGGLIGATMGIRAVYAIMGLLMAALLVPTSVFTEEALGAADTY